MSPVDEDMVPVSRFGVQGGHPVLSIHLFPLTVYSLSPLPPSSISFPSATFPAAAAERDGEQSHVPAHRERP